MILGSKPQNIAKNASFRVTTPCLFFWGEGQECKTRADIFFLVHHQPEDQFLGHGLVIFAIHWHCYNLKSIIFEFQVIWTLFDVILRSKSQKIAKNASFWVTTLCSFFFEGRQECKTRADICVLVHHQPEDQFLGHGLFIFAIHWHCYNLKSIIFEFQISFLDFEVQFRHLNLLRLSWNFMWHWQWKLWSYSSNFMTIGLV